MESGHNDRPRMADSRRSCCIIDEVHDDASMDISGRIGILGIHDLGHDNTAVFHSLPFHLRSPSQVMIHFPIS